MNATTCPGPHGSPFLFSPDDSSLAPPPRRTRWRGDSGQELNRAEEVVVATTAEPRPVPIN